MVDVSHPDSTESVCSAENQHSCSKGTKQPNKIIHLKPFRCQGSQSDDLSTHIPEQPIPVLIELRRFSIQWDCPERCLKPRPTKYQTHGYFCDSTMKSGNIPDDVELWWKQVDCEKNSLILEGQMTALYTHICQELRHT
jgi:hypothetical protein